MSSRRSPFEELERMVERMARRVDRAASELGEDLEPALSGSIPVDLADRGDAFVLTADLPGFDVGDIDLRVAGRRVDIEASREEATQTPDSAGTAETEGDADGPRDEPTYLRRERRRRSVTRSVSLPAPVEEGAVDAGYRNGVLTVTLPKLDEGDATSVDIE